MRLVEYSHAAKLGLWFDGAEYFILHGSRRFFIGRFLDQAKRIFFESVAENLEKSHG